MVKEKVSRDFVSSLIIDSNSPEGVLSKIDKSGWAICGIAEILFEKFNKLTAQLALSQMAPELTQCPGGQVSLKVRGQGVGARVLGQLKFL